MIARIPLRAVCALALVATGCATPANTRALRQAAPVALPAPASPFSLAPVAVPVRAAEDADFEQIQALLRGTIGLVVPMPGTELVNLGMVVEGATLQAANRNPGLEGLDREGNPGRVQVRVTVKIPQGVQ